MSNKSIVVYLIFGVILGLAGALAYIMVFHDMARTRWPRPMGKRLTTRDGYQKTRQDFLP